MNPVQVLGAIASAEGHVVNYFWDTMLESVLKIDGSSLGALAAQLERYTFFSLP